MKPVLLILLFSCAVSQFVVGGDLQLTETDDVIRVTLRGKRKRPKSDPSPR